MTLVTSEARFTSCCVLLSGVVAYLSGTTVEMNSASYELVISIPFFVFVFTPCPASDLPSL